MQTIDNIDIEQHISTPRLQTYSRLTGTSDLSTLIGAYQWNKRVSAAIYPILQCLEVTLRNAVHKAATSHFGTPDWYDPITKLAGNDKFKADIAKNPWKDNQFYRKGVSNNPKRNGRKHWKSHHENMIEQAKKKLANSNKTPTADAVIAELMFGFWVGLFESQYNDIQTTTRLWPHLDSIVFPHLQPANRTHSQVYSKLKQIKDLRNRLSHHEPIWKHRTVNNAQSSINYLSQITEEMIQLIGGMSKHRKELLFQSGQISYFRGVCSEECLAYYLSGAPVKKMDKRRLKRFVEKAVRKPQIFPVVIQDHSQPKFVVDLWPKEPK